MGISPSVGPLGPDAVNAFRFKPRPDSEHALGIVCQDGLVCIEPRRAPGTLGPISGIGRFFESPAGLPDIDEPDIRGQTLQTGPVVPGPIGDGNNLQFSVLRGRLRPHRPHLLADLAFQMVWFGSGSRAKDAGLRKPKATEFLSYPQELLHPTTASSFS